MVSVRRYNLELKSNYLHDSCFFRFIDYLCFQVKTTIVTNLKYCVCKALFFRAKHGIPKL